MPNIIGNFSLGLRIIDSTISLHNNLIQVQFVHTLANHEIFTKHIKYVKVKHVDNDQKRRGNLSSEREEGGWNHTSIKNEYMVSKYAPHKIVYLKFQVV